MFLDVSNLRPLQHMFRVGASNRSVDEVQLEVLVGLAIAIAARTCGGVSFGVSGRGGPCVAVQAGSQSSLV